MLTVDVARQNDIVVDFPTNPLNLLAVLNAALGNFYLHENYLEADTPLRQGQYGDTTYYLVPTPVIPLVMPLQLVPILGPALAVTLDPFVRVAVETGYDRTINPGKPTPTNLLYFPNPIHTLKNLLIAIPTGWDNGISYLAEDPDLRPFGTPIPTNPYGVNGPPVDTGCGTPPCGPPTPYLTTAPSRQAISAAPGNNAAVMRDIEEKPHDSEAPKEPPTASDSLDGSTWKIDRTGDDADGGAAGSGCQTGSCDIEAIDVDVEASAAKRRADISARPGDVTSPSASEARTAATSQANAAESADNTAKSAPSTSDSVAL